MPIIMNHSNANRIERSEVDLLKSKLLAIKSLRDNPMGVEVESFGQTYAFYSSEMPGPAFNVVKGLSEEDAEQIPAIMDFYQQRNMEVQFDLTPMNATRTLLQSLDKAGFQQIGFHSVLYQSTDEINVASIDEQRIYIRELHENEFDTYAMIYTEGFGLPSFLRDGVAKNNRVLFHKSGWSFYLATYKSEPAGIAVMFTQDGITTLYIATTIPTMREYGIHSQLIKRRLMQAKISGSELVVGQAAFASTSQHNMERAGLNMAYTKAIWGRSR
ncbi:GNAT family N-acetyltransferase [Alkalicoccobacillus porphyridii]|uniref:GNAT family N-acetyltransferase n=1 Tax=Alkalicoccobacillus porphyridii TaxID=2597270 RepID=A0A553ZWK6_9BACI|nr:GNAT family N-acetyltransferase [Alkalicoccobacillus porphyridii]TSB45716.1 GNAT family N-acetyltransferase [Alkalicoccobacillus porphyridii]